MCCTITKITYVLKIYGTLEVLYITTINHQSESLITRTVLNNAISDHLLILTELQLQLDYPKQNKRSRNFRKVDWPGFALKLEELCSQIKPKSSFTYCIHKAAKLSIPRGKRKTDLVPF